jgi:hypothetical protein
MRLLPTRAPTLPPVAPRWSERRDLASARSRRPAEAQHAVPSWWTGADILWEISQEQAALALRAGGVGAATEHWARALEIADRYFERGDPRLAASLTNHAVVLRRRRQVHQANRLFDQAHDVWADGWRWIELMRCPPQAGGASNQGYDRASRAQFTELLAKGQAATRTLAAYKRLPEALSGSWFELRPRRFTDVRKLLAAVLLIVPVPE